MRSLIPEDLMDEKALEAFVGIFAPQASRWRPGDDEFQERLTDAVGQGNAAAWARVSRMFGRPEGRQHDYWSHTVGPVLRLVPGVSIRSVLDALLQPTEEVRRRGRTLTARVAKKYPEWAQAVSKS